MANTLVRRDGGWLAENTDVDGLIGALRAAGAPAPRRALILGGGGTAASVLAALAELGADDVVIAGRRPQSTAACGGAGRSARPADPGDRLGCPCRSARRRTPPTWWCPPYRPVPQIDFADRLRAVPALFDVVYHPWPTALAAAGVPGRVTVTGLDMLLHQAFRQFELITGVPAPVQAMRQGLLAGSKTDLPLPV